MKKGIRTIMVLVPMLFGGFGIQGQDTTVKIPISGKVLWQCKPQSFKTSDPLRHSGSGYTNLPFIHYSPSIGGELIYWPCYKIVEHKFKFSVCAANISSGKLKFQIQIEDKHLFHGLLACKEGVWVVFSNTLQLYDTSGKKIKDIPFKTDSNPTLFEKRIYCIDSGIMEFDTENDNLVQLVKDIPTRGECFPGPYCDAGKICYVQNGRVIYIDKTHRKKIWETTLVNACYGVAVDNMHVYATGHVDLNDGQQNTLYKLNIKTGAIIKQIKLPEKARYRNSAFTPCIDKNFIFIAQPASFSVYKKLQLTEIFSSAAVDILEESVGNEKRSNLLKVGGEDNTLFAASIVTKAIKYGKNILITYNLCTMPPFCSSGIHGLDYTCFALYSPNEKKIIAKSKPIEGSPISKAVIHGQNIFQVTTEGWLTCYRFDKNK